MGSPFAWKFLHTGTVTLNCFKLIAALHRILSSACWHQHLKGAVEYWYAVQVELAVIVVMSTWLVVISSSDSCTCSGWTLDRPHLIQVQPTRGLWSHLLSWADETQAVHRGWWDWILISFFDTNTNFENSMHDHHDLLRLRGNIWEWVALHRPSHTKTQGHNLFLCKILAFLLFS